jgi:choice-of-anchor C domain-containing protein
MNILNILKAKSCSQAITVAIGASSSIFLAFAFELSASATNLIVNGSFEQGDYSSNIVDPNFARLNPGSSALTGWTIGGNGVDWHNGNDMKSPIEGDLIVDLNLDGGSSGTLSQTFSTTPGHFYTLGFYLAGPDLSATTPSFPNPRQVRVQVGGINQIFTTPASDHLALNWQLNELNFQATGNNTTLAFSGVNDSGFWGAALDNVSVISNSQSVPESSSILNILALGTLGTFSLLKRKLM